MIEINLTDQNFDQFIQNAKKPVLVDFWATWCMPCFILGPILEKVAEEYSEKLTLVKVNLDTAPQISQRYGIEQIPTVVLFKNGKPVLGFVGVRSEPAIKEFLEQALKKDLAAEAPKGGGGEYQESIERARNTETLKSGETPKNAEAPASPEIEKKIEEIIKSYETYAERNGFKLNPNREMVKRIIKGLLENEKKYGARYCPCRRISGDPEQDKAKICPCQWHKEEIERNGHCLCGLFVKNT